MDSFSLSSFNEIPASVGREEERGANLKKEEKRRRASPPPKTISPLHPRLRGGANKLVLCPVEVAAHFHPEKKTEGNPKFTKSLPTAHVL